MSSSPTSQKPRDPKEDDDFESWKSGKLRALDYAETANQAKEYARQNTGQMILISAAAGFLLGLLIRGRR